ncbi:unnamed protein product [Sphagnum troendelagicum]|uniref:PGG domain-containing protein n=1 Tax=Sphagnum troendelagicum TaxID=128251 RepID=A0ABP0UU46_9BRYO
MASTSAATTTKHQANTYLMEPTTSDDDSQVMGATSVVTTKHQPISDLVEATKSDEEAKAAAATSVATTNQEANSDLKEAAKSDGEAKAIRPTPVATTNEQADSDLREAAKTDDEAKAVAALTQSGVDVNCRGDPEFRYTPLILAILFNSVKVARVLLADPRVNVNATDISGQTAVHHSRPNALRAIIRSQRTGIDWNVVDKIGRTPLLSFARRNRHGEIQGLCGIESVDLFATSIDGFTALHEVAERESRFPDRFKKASPETSCNLVRVLFKLLEARGHNLVTFVNATDILNRSALHYLAEEGSVEMLKLLLEKCPTGKPFTFCEEWLARLDHSIQKGHLEVVKLLVAKAEPFKLDNNKEQMHMLENLLSVATEHNKKDIAVHLLDTLGLKAETLAQTSTEFSSPQSKLLAIAASENYFKIIRYVLNWHPEVDANVSIQLVAHKELVAPPLHFAALGGHVEAVRELLNHDKLDVNTKDTKNRTPLLCVMEPDKLAVVKALCSDPANRLRATEEDSDGRTPIQIATERNMKEIEKVLLERPEVKDFVDRLYRDRQVFVDAANSLLVGAALIASVTFAGWLQPPLGYIPDYEFSQPFPAPPQTPESYAAVRNHAIVKAFWVFNSLSFFFAIATVLAGAEAALPNLQHDFIGRQVKSVERALIRATILLVISVVCVLGAFASAGFAVLPPLLKYDTSMIITVCLGGTICMLTLAKIIWKLSTPIRMQFLKTWTTMTAHGHATGLT